MVGDQEAKALEKDLQICDIRSTHIFQSLGQDNERESP